MAKDGHVHARVDISFFFHDVRFNNLCIQHQQIYLTYWMVAVEQRREILSPGFDEHFIASLKQITKYFSKSFKSCIRNLQKFHPEPLLEWSSDGYVRVCGVRAKHEKLKWHDEDDKRLYDEKFSPQGTGEGKGKGKYNTSGGKKSSKKKAFDEYPDEVKGCVRELFKSIKQHLKPGEAYDKFKPHNIETWKAGTADAIRLMHEVDKLSFEQIREYIEKVRTDKGSGTFPGYGRVVRSGAKLRHHYKEGNLDNIGVKGENAKAEPSTEIWDT